MGMCFDFVKFGSWMSIAMIHVISVPELRQTAVDCAVPKAELPWGLGF
jgi:hypothetical protein